MYCLVGQQSLLHLLNEWFLDIMCTFSRCTDGFSYLCFDGHVLTVLLNAMDTYSCFTLCSVFILILSFTLG